MNEPVSLSDLARELGLHKSTVGRALSGHPSIPEPTRTRVKALAKARGYQRDPKLGIIAAHRWKRPARNGACIAWVNEGHVDPARALIGGASVEQACAELGYKTIPLVVPYGHPPTRVQRQVRAMNLDGVLLGTVNTPAMLDGWNQFPVVRLRLRGALNTPFAEVGPDRSEAIRIAWKMAFEQGYRRPGLVTFDERSEMDELHRSGAFLYLQSTVRNPIPILRLPVRPAEQWADPGGIHSRLKHWFLRFRPDVILGINPLIYSYLTSAGISIPDRVAFISLQRTIADVAGLMDDELAYCLQAIHLLDLAIRQRRTGTWSPGIRLYVEPVWQGGPTLPAKTRHSK